jgi:hypothetical protein
MLSTKRDFEIRAELHFERAEELANDARDFLAESLPGGEPFHADAFRARRIQAEASAELAKTFAGLAELALALADRKE